MYDSLAQPVIEKSLIEGPLPVSVELVYQPLMFKIVEGGSERGKHKRVDSCGYSYYRELKRQAFCSGRRSGVVCQVPFVSRECENLNFGIVSTT